MPSFPTAWKRLPITLSNLNIAHTLPVGQSFLWHRKTLDDGTLEFSRALDHPPRVIFLRQTPTDLWYTSRSTETLDPDIDLPWLRNYFQLDRHASLEQLYEEWRERDPELFGTADLAKAQGVRVLRQDPWECLVAFITSSNNHIPRITSLLHRLAQTYGQKLDLGDDGTYHLFPEPHALDADMDATLRKMGFGYRAGFLDSTVRTLREGYGSLPGQVEAGLISLREKETSEVREELLKLKGVGRKVADCVMLMSMDKAASIPIDTHVLAIASRHPSFPRRLRNKSMTVQVYNEVQDFLIDKWGPLGGWCQAVLFAADLKPTTTTVKVEIAVAVERLEDLGRAEKRKTVKQVETTVKRSRTKMRVEEVVTETSIRKNEST